MVVQQQQEEEAGRRAQGVWTSKIGGLAKLLGNNFQRATKQSVRVDFQ
jgi:hypothetical protein